MVRHQTEINSYHIQRKTCITWIVLHDDPIFCNIQILNIGVQKCRCGKHNTCLIIMCGNEVKSIPLGFRNALNRRLNRLWLDPITTEPIIDGEYIKYPVSEGYAKAFFERFDLARFIHG